MIAPPAGGTVSSPAWSADGRAVYAVGRPPRLRRHLAFRRRTGAAAPVPLTRTQGAALAPAPARRTARGSSILSLAAGRLRPPPAGAPSPRAAAAAPPAPEMPRELAPPSAPPPPARPSRSPAPRWRRAGPTAWDGRSCSRSSAASVSSTGGVWELGCAAATAGAPRLARSSARSAITAGPQGGALAAAWRGWPVDGGLPSLPFQRSGRPERKPWPAAATSLDLDRQGIELCASRDWRWSGGALDLAGRALWDQVEPASRDVSLDQRLLALTGAWSGYRRWGPWRLQPSLWGALRSGPHRGDGAGPAGGARRVSGSATRTPAWPSPGAATPRGTSASASTATSSAARRPRCCPSRRCPTASPCPPCRWAPGWARPRRAAGGASLGFLPAPVFYERHRVWGFGDPRGRLAHPRRPGVPLPPRPHAGRPPPRLRPAGRGGADSRRSVRGVRGVDSVVAGRRPGGRRRDLRPDSQRRAGTAGSSRLCRPCCPSESLLILAPARLPPSPMSTHLLILRLSGDFYTKARRTRMRFFRRLVANLEAALKAHGIPYTLEPTWSRLYLETPEPGGGRGAGAGLRRAVGLAGGAAFVGDPGGSGGDRRRDLRRGGAGAELRRARHPPRPARPHRLRLDARSSASSAAPCSTPEPAG